MKSIAQAIVTFLIVAAIGLGGIYLIAKVVAHAFGH